MKFKSDLDLLFSRGEPEDPRLGDIAQMPALREFEKGKWDIAIIGLPDDRGVLLNRGRGGASEGPDAIRKWFYRLVPPCPSLRIADLGNLIMSENLEADHATATDAVAVALGHAKRVVILGGGHDWGYSPVAALAQGGRTGFISVDAHLDVRASGLQHSGTSYWRALETIIKGEDAFWLGAQRPSTAKLHLDYVCAKGGTVVFAEDLAKEIDATLAKSAACELVDLSLDMDVFVMSEAPGVSAPQPSGLPARELLPVLKRILQDPKVRTFGIYELSPPNDVQEATARLAARCLWEALDTSDAEKVKY